VRHAHHRRDLALLDELADAQRQPAFLVDRADAGRLVGVGLALDGGGAGPR